MYVWQAPWIQVWDYALYWILGNPHNHNHIQYLKGPLSSLEILRLKAIRIQKDLSLWKGLFHLHIGVLYKRLSPCWEESFQCYWSSIQFSELTKTQTDSCLPCEASTTDWTVVPTKDVKLEFLRVTDTSTELEWKQVFQKEYYFSLRLSCCCSHGELILFTLRIIVY